MLRSKLLDIARAGSEHQPLVDQGSNDDQQQEAAEDNEEKGGGQKNFRPSSSRKIKEDVSIELDAVKRLRRKIQANRPDVHRANYHNLRQRFLYRLAVALHSFGSSASRTEYLIERAAEHLDIQIKIAVFPSLILLAFSDHAEDSKNECHLITVESDLDVDKLGRTDELANSVGKRDVELFTAYWRLKTIATSPSRFGSWPWRIFSFALSAATAAPLFFEGNMWDACFSFVLGLVVGLLDTFTRSHILTNLVEFMFAVVISFLARIFSVYLTTLRLCFSSMALSALVQLLPGLSLTLGVSNMVAKSHVTGASIIVYGLFSALQLGFGLSTGESLVWWIKESKIPTPQTCQGSSVSAFWNILWLLGYTVSSNVLLNARPNQWPGMSLASGVGYIVSTLTGEKLGSSGSSVLAAFAVGITGTSYSYFTGDLPLVMILSGILLLLPGGLGVQGMKALVDEDVPSGMGFVFEMLVVGLSITIGLLLAKIVLPAALLGQGKRTANDKTTLAAEFEEEDMAL